MAIQLSVERQKGHNVTIILLNQFRSKVGLVFGDPRTLPGGRQINHIPSTKLELKNKEIKGEDRFGHGIVECNEHEYIVTKAKHGSSQREGSFRMMVNPDNELRLPVGAFDDSDTLATYAKNMSFITGGGQSWKVHGIGALEGQKFTSLKALKEMMRDHPEHKLQLAQMVIANQRTTKGLKPIPDDGYLLDWVSSDLLGEA